MHETFAIELTESRMQVPVHVAPVLLADGIDLPGQPHAELPDSLQLLAGLLPVLLAHGLEPVGV